MAAHRRRQLSSNVRTRMKEQLLSSNPSDQLQRLTAYFKPSESDPTLLVLKAHLLVEEVLYEFIQSQSHQPKYIEDARLSFAQCISLAKAFHRFSRPDWWAWIALSKLNSLRNLLAHNLEPTNTKQKIVDFTVYVAQSIGVTKESEIATEFELLTAKGMHPFMLSLVALHVAVCITLGYEPEEKLSKQERFNLSIERTSPDNPGRASNFKRFADCSDTGPE
jgi:hypothetical protein